MREEHSPVWQVIGPLTLLCAFAAASALPLTASLFDLYFIGAGGLFLSARWHIKGCAYAFILLILAGIAGHIFLESHHFLRLSLEASMSCSFFITALAFENETILSLGLKSQIESKSAAIQNFEEEAVRVGQSLIDTQIESLKKIEELQKSFEELHSEKSSLEILNDVLRKTNAGHFQEMEAVSRDALQDKRRCAEAFSDLDAIQTELARLKKESLAVENGLLMKELNAARFEKEQAQQINEMLVCLHAKECLKTKEAADQLQQVTNEKLQIDHQIAELREELSLAIQGREQAEEKAANRESVLEKRESEIAGKERWALKEQLNLAEKTIHDLIKIDFLYKQLKKQFEDKNRVLYETRSILFKTETELQTLRIEKEEQNNFLLPDAIRAELERVDEEIRTLTEENKTLQDLVTHLTDTAPHHMLFAANRIPLPTGQPSLEETLRKALIPKRKKKTKKPAQQDLLF